MTVKQVIKATKEGLPREAYAIRGFDDDPGTWKLPHHTRSIFLLPPFVEKVHKRNFKHIKDIESTVDWDRMSAAVAALSPGGYRGERVKAGAEDIIEAARHLAEHYRKAGKAVPDTLQALL